MWNLLSRDTLVCFFLYTPCSILNIMQWTSSPLKWISRCVFLSRKAHFLKLINFHLNLTVLRFLSFQIHFYHSITLLNSKTFHFKKSWFHGREVIYKLLQWPQCWITVDTEDWSVQSVQSLSCVRLFATPWTAAHQASLSFTNSWSLLKFRSIESVMLSNHLILCWPLLLLPSVFPSIRIFSSGSALHIGGQSTGASASASVLPMNIQGWFPLGLTGLISLQSKGLSRVFSNTTVQKHQFFGAQLSSQSNSHIHTWPLEKP